MKEKILRVRDENGTLIVCVAWACFGVVLMILLRHGLLPDALFNLHTILAEFVPSIAQMDSVKYFNPTLAKAHASIMFVMIPVMCTSLFCVEVEGLARGILAKGKGNTIFTAVFVSLLGSITYFTGFGSHGPGSIFQSSSEGFSILSSILTINSAFCFRFSIFLFIRK